MEITYVHTHFIRCRCFHLYLMSVFRIVWRFSAVYSHLSVQRVLLIRVCKMENGTKLYHMLLRPLQVNLLFIFRFNSVNFANYRIDFSAKTSQL